MEDCEETIIEYRKTTVYTRGGQFVAKCVKTDNSEHWFNADGKQHRVDGPAAIYYIDGRIFREIWYCDDILHRVDGPAVIYYKNGQKTREYWYLDGKRDGDALAYVWLADLNDFSYVWFNKTIRNLDEFRTVVKGPLALELMRPLPIPIRDAIYEHYCMQ